MTEYNKELCDERHKNISEAFDRAFSKIGRLGDRMTGALIAIISTLVAVLINLALTFFANGK